MMRVYSKWDKSISEIILSQRRDALFGSLIKDQLNQYDSAIVIIPFSSDVFVLTNESKTKEIIYQRIVDTISLLSYYEKEGMIYCLLDTNTSARFLYKGNESQLGREQNVEQYTSNSGYIININNDEAICSDQYQKVILKGEKVSNTIAKELIRYYFSAIYPTSLLQELKKQNYISPEEAAYKREIKDAKLSRNISWGALFLSLFMPLFAVNYSNWVGKTTINPSQYDSIVTNQKDYSSKLESINDSIMGLFHTLRLKSQDTIISRSTNTNTKDSEPVKKIH